MNTFTLPPCPNWTGSNVATVSSDGVFIYAARTVDIVILKTSNDPNIAADFKIITAAHKERVTTVAIDQRNWSQESHKLIASIGQDNMVKVWDSNTLNQKLANSAHRTSGGKCVTLNFVDNNVISISDNGQLCVWNIVLNTFRLISHKHLKRVTAMVTYEQNPSITAVGTASGSVIIMNTKGSGTRLHKLKPSKNEIYALSFCPDPQESIYKTKDDVEDLCNKLENCTTEPRKEKEVITKANAWNNLKFPDDDEIIEEPSERHEEMMAKFNASDDFLQDCIELKQELDKINDSDEDETSPVSSKRSNQTINDIVCDEEANEDIKQADATTYEYLDNTVDNVEENTTLNNNENSLFMTICAKGGEVSIWEIGDKIVRSQKVLSLPSKKKTQYKSRSYLDNVRITANWALPNVVLASTTNGELYVWDFSGEKDSIRLIHSDHKSKAMYAIITPPYHKDLKLSDLKVWSLGFDRSIICTALSANRKCLNYYPTFNGFIYDICPSPLDPYRLAISGGDHTLRMLDLSKPHTNVININTAGASIMDKVLVARWHPVLENTLAFACADGRVGIIDPTCPTKMYYLKHYSSKPIYVISWAPKPGLKDKFDLYACINGSVIVYENKSKDSDPRVLKFECEETFKSMSFAWKPDYSVVIVGGRDGTLLFLAREELKVLCTVYDLKKGANQIAWHYPMTTNENEESKYLNYVAIASLEHHILVYNCTDLLNGTRPDIVAKLEGHTGAVNTVAWSPHSSGLLASCSIDGTARIWNVIEQTTLSIFTNNLLHLTCIIWSPFDADIILTGSKDTTLSAWKISEHPPVLDREHKKVNVLNAAREKSIGDSKTITNSSEDVGDNVLTAESETKPKREHLLDSVKTLQYKTGDESCELLDRLLKYVDTNGTGDTENVIDSDPVKLFGTEQDVKDLLEVEISKNSSFRLGHFTLWKGNIKEVILNAIETKTLTPELINLAPMVSHSFWRDTVTGFTEQLLSQNDFLHASKYYLILHESEKAVKTLIDGNLFQEALALTKLHLPEDEALIKDILHKWVAYTKKTGSYEVAAQCYIALKEFGEAAKVLSRRNEMPTLKLALKLATKADNADLVKSIELAIDTLNETKVEKEEELPPLPTIGEMIVLQASIKDLSKVVDHDVVTELIDTSCDSIEDINVLEEIQDVETFGV